jgi:hypothetical protein
MAAEGLVLFPWMKKNQKIKSAKRLLFARAFALQIRKTTGCNIFAPLSLTQPYASAKSCYALVTAQATIVLPDFVRSRLADVFKLKYILKKKSKKRKGLPETRARESGPWAEGFFRLDLLVTFGSSQK